jgi:hypothetical protein
MLAPENGRSEVGPRRWPCRRLGLFTASAIACGRSSLRWSESRKRSNDTTVVHALGAEFFPRLTQGNPVCIKPHEVARFQRECALLREHLDAICGSVDLAGQHGIAVDMETGQVISPSASRETFRQLVSLHWRTSKTAAQRAAQAAG